MSSGFAFVHADSSTDVCAVEAVKLEDLDPDAVRAGLQVRGSCRLGLQGSTVGSGSCYSTVHMTCLQC